MPWRCFTFLYLLFTPSTAFTEICVDLTIKESFNDGLNANITVASIDGEVILALPAQAVWYNYYYDDDAFRTEQFCVLLPACLTINATSTDPSSQLTWTLDDGVLNGTVSDTPTVFAITTEGDIIEGECTLSPTPSPTTSAPTATLAPTTPLPACFNMTLYDANGESWSRSYYRVKRNGEIIISAADMHEPYVQYDMVCIDMPPACIGIDIVAGDMGLGGEVSISWELGDGFYHGGPPPFDGEYTYEFYLIDTHELVNGSCTPPPTSDSPTLSPSMTASPTISPAPTAAPTTAFPSASPFAQMCFNLTMTDTCGDGWNGAYYYVESVVEGEELAYGTMPDLRSSTDPICPNSNDDILYYMETICIDQTSECLLFRVTKGFFEEEIGWTLGDGDVSGGAPEPGTGFKVLPSGEVVSCKLPNT